MLYAAALLVAVAGARWAGGNNADVAQEVVRAAERSGRPQHSLDDARASVAEAALQVQLDKLAPRVQAVPAGNPLHAQSWEQDSREGAEQRGPSRPPPPSPPPLPFSYLGQLIDEGNVTVFLRQQGSDGNYVVRQGDTLDGTYRVDALDERRAVLTYLPLGHRQELVFEPVQTWPTHRGTLSTAMSGPPAVTALQAGPTPPAFPSGEPTGLLLGAPGKAVVGQEFIITLGIPAGYPGVSASVELAYDSAVLSAVQRERPTAEAPGAPPSYDPGRRQVEIASPTSPGLASTPTPVRFRVVATAPTTTQIRIESVSAVDSSGRALSFLAPTTISLAIVRP